MEVIMKKNRIICLLLAAILLLGGCGNAATNGDEPAAEDPTEAIGTTVSSDTLYVEKVENLPEDFILGMDASCVPALEAGGVRYFDHNGEEKDVYQILSENGIN